MNRRHKLGCGLLGFAVYFGFTRDLWPDRMVTFFATRDLYLDQSTAADFIHAWILMLVVVGAILWIGLPSRKEIAETIRSVLYGEPVERKPQGRKDVVAANDRSDDNENLNQKD